MNITKKVIVTVLSIMMVISMMPVNIFAEVQHDADQAEAMQNAAAVENAEADETAEPEGDVGTSDASNESEASLPAADAAPSKSTQQPEQADENKQQAGSTNDADADDYPAQSFSGKAGAVSVTAKSPDGAFPAGTEMKVAKADIKKVKNAASDMVDGEVVDAAAVDITFYDKNGKEIQPNGDVRISLSLGSALDGENYAVIHIDDSGVAEVIDEIKVTDRSASFEAGSFSIYAVVGSDGKEDEQIVRRTYIFLKDDGSEWDRQIVKNGDTLVEPGVPSSATSDRYFDGWYTEETGGDKATFGVINDISNKKGSEDETVNIYARYVYEYTVTFYDENDDIEAIRGSVPGTEIPMVQEIPELAEQNLVLIGWSKEKDSQTADYSLSDTYTIDSSNPEDIELYPVLQSVRKVEFDLNSGDEYVAPVAPQYVKPGDVATKPDDPSRTGYTFNGWYTSKDTQDSSTAYDFNTAVPAGDDALTLYAGWTAQEVSFHVYIWGEVMDDDGNPIPEGESGRYAVLYDYTDTMTAGTEVTEQIARENFAKNVTADKFDTKYYTLITDFSDFVGTTIKGDGSSIFNVYFDLKEFEIKFTVWQGATIYVGSEGHKGEYSFTAKLGQNLDDLWPDRVDRGTSSYKFSGWLRDTYPSGSLRIITKRHRLESDDIYNPETGEVTVYREQTMTSPYSITLEYWLESPDGTGTLYNGKYYNKSDYYSQSNIPAYSTAGLGTGKMIDGYTRAGTVKRSNTSYIYYYDLETETLTFRNYNVKHKEIDYLYGASIEEEPAPNIEDTSLIDTGISYTFMGWYTDEQYINKYDFSGAKMPSHNLVLYAYWKPNDITITFDPNGGTLTDDETQNIESGSRVKEPTEPTKEGYDFLYWGEQGKDAGDVVNFDIRTFTEDTTLVAHWTTTIEEVKIKYVDNEEGHESPVDNKTYRSDGEFLVMKSPSSASSHEFHGYKIDGYGDTIYRPGQVVDIVPEMIQKIDGENVITLVAYHGEDDKEDIESLTNVKVIYNSNFPEAAGKEDIKVTDSDEDGKYARNEAFDAFTANQAADKGIICNGYELIEWNTDPSGDGESFKLGQKIAADKNGENNLYAIWHAATVDYKEEYYLEKLDGSYELKDSNTVKDAVVGTSVTISNMNYSGFTRDDSIDGSNPSGVVADGLVLKACYKRNTETLSYRYENAPSGITAPSATTHKYEEEAAVDKEFKAGDKYAGYTFGGWKTIYEDVSIYDKGGDPYIKMTRDITLVGSWTASTDTSYKIEYYFQNIDESTGKVGSDYVRDDSFTRTSMAQTGSTVYASYSESIPGFTFNKGVTATHMDEGQSDDADNKRLSGKVTADADSSGTLVFRLYYDRAGFKAIYQYASDVSGEDPSASDVADYDKSTHFYGEKVLFKDPATAEGYTFKGWTVTDALTTYDDDGDGKPDGFYMPERDARVTGDWSANTNTKFTIEYYQETLEDGKFEKIDAETETLKGTTGAHVASATTKLENGKDAEKTFEGFTLDTNVSGTVSEADIAADGTTVLKLYYTRNSYTFNYFYRGSTPVGGESIVDVRTNNGISGIDGIKVKYGQTLTAYNIADVEHYEFYGWYGNIDGDISTTVDLDQPENRYAMAGEERVDRGATFTMPAADLSLFAAYKGKNDADFRIEHWTENVDSTDSADKSNYTLKETEPATGVASGLVYAQPTSNYIGKGFTYNEGLTSHADVDNPSVTNWTSYDNYDAEKFAHSYGGSAVLIPKTDTTGYTVIRIYYTRVKNYNLTYKYTNNVSGATDITDWKKSGLSYEQSVNINSDTDALVNGGDDSVSAPGYTFSGWQTYLAGDSDQFNMPARDVEVFGSWEANKDTKYKVKYWFQNIGGDENDLSNYTQNQLIAPDITKTGTTGQTGYADLETYTGFTINDALTEQSGTISGYTDENDMLVLNVYYTRNKAKVTYHYNNEIEGETDISSWSEEVYYGDTVKINTTTDAVIPLHNDSVRASGYDFSNWYTSRDLDNTYDGDMQTGFTMPDGDVTVYGDWTAAKNVKYVVEHYYEQTAGSQDYSLAYKVWNETSGTIDDKTCTGHEFNDGVTGSKAPYTTDRFDGYKQVKTEFVSRSATTGRETVKIDETVLGDGTLVIKIYYDLITYDLTYYHADPHPSAASTPDKASYAFGTWIPLDTTYTAGTSYYGYKFDGWTTTHKDLQIVEKDGVKGIYMPHRDAELEGDWTQATDMTYSVIHMVKGSDADSPYEQRGAVTIRSGATGSEGFARPLSIEGIKLQGIKTRIENAGKTIDPEDGKEIINEMRAAITADKDNDPTLVFTFYYEKEQYKVGYEITQQPKGKTVTPPAEKKYDFEEKAKVETPEQVPGYTFSGWETSDVTVENDEFSMPAKYVKFTGKYVANTDTAYTVEYYVQDLGAGTYSKLDAETVNKEGTTDTKAPYDKKSLTGFTYEKAEFVSRDQGTETKVNDETILGDGSLVIKLYYNRNSYNVIYHYTGSVPAGANSKIPVTKQYQYGEEVTLEDAPFTGYDSDFANYIFLGDDKAKLADASKDWTTNPSATPAIEIKDRKFTMPARDVNLNGRWATDYNNNGTDDATEEFTVTYTDGVDSEEVFADKSTDGLKVGDATPSFGEDPTRTDYIFDGWNPAVQTTVRARDSVNNVITYTAQWKEDRNNNGIPDEDEEFTVVYKDSDGSDLNKVEDLSVGDKLDEYKPTKTNYVFDKWSPEWKDTVDAADANKDSEIIYNASWKDDKNNNGKADEDEEFTVIYKDSDGSVLKKEEKLSVGDNLSEYKPTKTNYVFDKWSPTWKNTVDASDANKDSEIIYTASWKDDKNNNGIPDEDEHVIVKGDPPVKKIVSGDGAPSSDTFRFRLKAVSNTAGIDVASMPMPAGSSGSSKISDDLKAGEEYEFGDIDFDTPGTYEYEITEINDGISGYTYDDSVYTVKYVIAEKDGKLVADRIFQKDGKDVTVAVFEFNNTYDKSADSRNSDGDDSIDNSDNSKDGSDSSSNAVKTGDSILIILWIAALALAAALVVIMIIRRRRNKEE